MGRLVQQAPPARTDRQLASRRGGSALLCPGRGTGLGRLTQAKPPPRNPVRFRAKACGVSDMAFHKKSGLKVEDMVRSRWVYRKLRNFRAGIEAGISCLKRAYGFARCTWRGLDHFKAYVWSSVVAYNLVVFVRLRSA